MTIKRNEKKAIFMKINETNMYKEILEQGHVLKQAYENNIDKIKEIARYVKDNNISSIFLVARGSSDNACQYFKYLCEIYAGIPVGFIAPSIVTLYNGKVLYKNSLVIGVSQSGSGLDIHGVIESANNIGAFTVGITNNKDSLLAKTAKCHLDLSCKEELSVAATKTFISEMYVLSLLVSEIGESEELRKALNYDHVQDVINKTIENKDKIFKLSKQCLDYYDAYLLARGINYVSSLEGALKLQETTYVKSKTYAISDFYHGPFAIVDDKTNVFLLHGKGKADKDVYEMFDKLINLNANVIVISNDQHFANYQKTIFVPMCEEVVSPFALVTTMQLFSLGLSIAKGLNPDQPRSLKKVTITK